MAPAIAQSDAAALYKKQDLSLKEGQTIKYGCKPTWHVLLDTVLFLLASAAAASCASQL